MNAPTKRRRHTEPLFKTRLATHLFVTFLVVHLAWMRYEMIVRPAPWETPLTTGRIAVFLLLTVAMAVFANVVAFLLMDEE